MDKRTVLVDCNDDFRVSYMRNERAGREEGWDKGIFIFCFESNCFDYIVIEFKLHAFTTMWLGSPFDTCFVLACRPSHVTSSVKAVDVVNESGVN
jgi:hypothetical protein